MRILLDKFNHIVDVSGNQLVYQGKNLSLRADGSFELKDGPAGQNETFNLTSDGKAYCSIGEGDFLFAYGIVDE